MRATMSQLNLSARAYHRTLKLARTIADLAGSDDIQSVHLAEALQYRLKVMMGQEARTVYAVLASCFLNNFMESNLIICLQPDQDLQGHLF
jgi:hypothetical protein